jgi:hypothetical protein
MRFICEFFLFSIDPVEIAEYQRVRRGGEGGAGCVRAGAGGLLVGRGALAGLEASGAVAFRARRAQ